MFYLSREIGVFLFNNNGNVLYFDGFFGGWLLYIYFK